MFRDHTLYQEDIKNVASLSLPWGKMKNKVTLVTGASGLLGTFLIDVLMYRNRYFGNNLSIMAVGRNEKAANERFKPYRGSQDFTFIRHDINHPLPEIGVADFIIHAASNTHPVSYASDPIGTITANIIGTNNLLSYAVKHNTERFMFLSSVEIYGENRGDVDKFDENYCGYINCNTLRAGYPEGKRAGEALCQAFIKKHGLNIVIARLSRTYGPTMLLSDSKAIAQFILNGIKKQDIILKSEGEQFYSYTYVADAVSAILTILLCGEKGNAYNIADSSSDIKLKELANIVSQIVGTNVVFNLPDEIESAGFSKATKAIMSAKKLKQLGWEAKTDIRSGVQKTIDIMKETISMKKG